MSLLYHTFGERILRHCGWERGRQSLPVRLAKWRRMRYTADMEFFR